MAWEYTNEISKLRGSVLKERPQSFWNILKHIGQRASHPEGLFFESIRNTSLSIGLSDKRVRELIHLAEKDGWLERVSHNKGGYHKATVRYKLKFKEKRAHLQGLPDQASIVDYHSTNKQARTNNERAEASHSRP